MRVFKIFVVLTFVASFAFVFVRAAQAQSNIYSNELKGYEFFAKRKLANLKLGVSTKEDVKKIFGKNCEKTCDLDADWTVNFSFYENNWTKEDVNEKGEKLVHYLQPKYLEKLRKIEISPKKRLSFTNISFPNAFQKLSRSQITKTPQGKSKMITYDVFQDADGLTYELYNSTDHDDIKTRDEKLYSRNDLFSIRYNISKEQEKVMFTQKKNK